VNKAATTYAHWLLASRQVLTDLPAIEQLINDRLLDGLSLKVEADFLLGADNLLANAGTITTAATTKPDVIAALIANLSDGGHSTNLLVMRSDLWLEISTLKTTQGEYLLPAVQDAIAPRLWGVPVLIAPSMRPAQYLPWTRRRHAKCLNAKRRSLWLQAKIAIIL
jgi:HK97 family phage major capsid protein